MFLPIQLTYSQLIWARVHLGHSWANSILFATWFIYAFRQGLSIIHLRKFMLAFNLALTFLAASVACSGPIWFINLERASDLYVRFSAQDCGEFSVTKGWISGLVSNTMVIFRAYKQLLRMNANGWSLRRNRQALLFDDFVLSRYTWPRCLFISSVFFSSQAAVESYSGAAGIGVVDTNTYSQVTSSPLPGSDDSSHTLIFYNQLISRIVLNRKFGLVLAWYLNLKKSQRMSEFLHWISHKNAFNDKPSQETSSIDSLGMKYFLSLGGEKDNLFESLDVFETVTPFVQLKDKVTRQPLTKSLLKSLGRLNSNIKLSTVWGQWFRRKFFSLKGLKSRLLPRGSRRFNFFGNYQIHPFRFRYTTSFHTSARRLLERSVAGHVLLYSFLRLYRNLGRVRKTLLSNYKFSKVFQKGLFSDALSWLRCRTDFTREGLSHYDGFSLSSMRWKKSTPPAAKPKPKRKRPVFLAAIKAASALRAKRKLRTRLHKQRQRWLSVRQASKLSQKLLLLNTLRRSRTRAAKPLTLRTLSIFRRYAQSKNFSKAFRRSFFRRLINSNYEFLSIKLPQSLKVPVKKAQRPEKISVGKKLKRAVLKSKPSWRFRSGQLATPFFPSSSSWSLKAKYLGPQKDSLSSRFSSFFRMHKLSRLSVRLGHYSTYRWDGYSLYPDPLESSKFKTANVQWALSQKQSASWRLRPSSLFFKNCS